MPKVRGKHFAYTKEGKEAAAAHAAKTGGKVEQSGPYMKSGFKMKGFSGFGNSNSPMKQKESSPLEHSGTKYAQEIKAEDYGGDLPVERFKKFRDDHDKANPPGHTHENSPEKMKSPMKFTGGIYPITEEGIQGEQISDLKAAKIEANNERLEKLAYEATQAGEDDLAQHHLSQITDLHRTGIEDVRQKHPEIKNIEDLQSEVNRLGTFSTETGGYTAHNPEDQELLDKLSSNLEYETRAGGFSGEDETKRQEALNKKAREELQDQLL